MDKFYSDENKDLLIQVYKEKINIILKKNKFREEKIKKQNKLELSKIKNLEKLQDHNEKLIIKYEKELEELPNIRKMESIDYNKIIEDLKIKKHRLENNIYNAKTELENIKKEKDIKSKDIISLFDSKNKKIKIEIENNETLLQENINNYDKKIQIINNDILKLVSKKNSRKMITTKMVLRKTQDNVKFMNSRNKSMNIIINFNEDRKNLDKKRIELNGKLELLNNEYNNLVSSYYDKKEYKLINLNKNILHLKDREKNSDYFNKIKDLRDQYDREMDILNRELILKKRNVQNLKNEIYSLDIIFIKNEKKINNRISIINNERDGYIQEKEKLKEHYDIINDIEGLLNIKYIELKNLSELKDTIKSSIEKKNKELLYNENNNNLERKKLIDNLFRDEIDELEIILEDYSIEKSLTEDKLTKLNLEYENYKDAIINNEEKIKQKKKEYKHIIENIRKKNIKNKIEIDKKEYSKNKLKRESINNNLNIKELLRVQEIEKKIKQLDIE